MAQSASSQTGTQSADSSPESINIPSSLKLVLSNIKMIVPESLSNENYPIWKSQILKLLRANGFAGYIDNTTPKPSRLITHSEGSTAANPAFTQWLLIDQNLAAALCSTISSSILPYVLHIDSTAEIWHTLEQRLQASN